MAMNSAANNAVNTKARMFLVCKQISSNILVAYPLLTVYIYIRLTIRILAYRFLFGKSLEEFFLKQGIVLELKHITVARAYGDTLVQRPILNNIDLKLHQGQWLTLLGANGSGKSTLARAIAGFKMTDASGEVVRPKGNKPIPIVLQQPEAAMLGATPWEDVLLMLEQNGAEEQHIPKWAEQALEQVGLRERMHQSITTLSGGQKQLTAIAGCLALQTPLLVLDEVTAMLHPETAADVLERVRELNRQGVTVIWITQNLEELRSEDRIAAMVDGEIVYDGDMNGWFSRTSRQGGRSLCEQYGFEAPYCVQVAWELEAIGSPLDSIPLTPEELAAASARLIWAEGEDA